MAIHSGTLAWKIPWTEKPGRLQSMGSQRDRHNWATSLSYSLPFFLSFFLSYSEFNHPALMHISILTSISLISGLPRWLVIKNPPANSGDIGDTGLIPGMGRSPGGMATHSSILAWRLPQTEKPGELQSIGSQRVRHNWNNLACTHTVLFQRPYLPSKYLLKRKWRKSERKEGKQEKCRPDLCQALGQML